MEESRNENMEKKVCPGCDKHCELSAPGCDRGEEYARTGVLPERRKGEHGHGRPERPPHYEAMDVNEKLAFNLRELGRMAHEPGERKAGQRQILTILRQAEGMTQRELTEQLRIQPGSASEILGKMESAGWILREPNSADRRTVNVRLTPEGASQADQGVDERRERHGEIFACLTDQETETLLLLLEKLYADWDAKRGKDRGPKHGPHEGPERGPKHGPHDGPEHGPEHGPHHGPDEGPERGPRHGHHDGPERGPHRGPHDGPEHGPHDGPEHGPHHGPHDGPEHGPRHEPHGDPERADG